VEHDPKISSSGKRFVSYDNVLSSLVVPASAVGLG
jgi:hypothetical protein